MKSRESLAGRGVGGDVFSDGGVRLGTAYIACTHERFVSAASLGWEHSSLIASTFASL